MESKIVRTELVLSDFDSDEELVKNLDFNFDGMKCLFNYMIDALKRNQRLDPISKKLMKILDTREVQGKSKIKKIITEKSLIIQLIQQSLPIDKPRLGMLIAKNDYSIPLLFKSMLSDEYVVDFDTLGDVLLRTKKSLVLNYGTKSSKLKGKSSLIPLIFDGLKSNRAIFQSGKRTLADSVDIIINESLSEWIVADFNGALTSNEAQNLLKALTGLSSLQFFHLTIEDFKEDFEILKEFLGLFDMIESSVLQRITFVVLIRDFESRRDDSDESDDDIDYKTNERICIEVKLKSLFENALHSKNVEIMFVENIETLRNQDETLKLKNLIERIKSVVEKTLHKCLRSVEDLKNAYYNDAQSLVPYETKFEDEFEKVFKILKSSNLNCLESMFPLSFINEEIYKEDKELKSMFYNSSSFDKTKHEKLQKKINDLSNIKQQINPLNEYLIFFIKNTNVTNMGLFQELLSGFTSEIVRNLNDELVKEKSKLIGCSKIDREKVEQNIEIITEKILERQLTVERFWDELMLACEFLQQKTPKYVSSLLSKVSDTKDTNESFNELVEKYCSMVKYGFPVHILRGSPLKIESKMLPEVFKILNDDSKKIFVVSVIGEQSSAKSSLLNALFGCDFRSGPGRCTVGVYMNYVDYGNRRIVILDTEGLMSVESGNKNVTFDNQMATMMVMSSHLVIINHKGEISSNLERLLSVTFYAKLRIGTSSYKPTIMFVLRDQNQRSDSSIYNQALRLKNSISQEASFIEEKLDDILDIDTKNVILLPNTFSEDKNGVTGEPIKWRNDIFPDEAMKLRRLIVKKLDDIDCTEQNYVSLVDLYDKMVSYWQTIIEIGDNIMNCKDLAEIRIRNEVKQVVKSLSDKISDHMIMKLFEAKTDRHNDTIDTKLQIACQDEINSKLDKIINDGLSLMIDSTSDEQINKIVYTIEQTADALKIKLMEKYDDLVMKVKKYPLAIKQEYKTRVEEMVERVKQTAINKWRSSAEKLKQRNILRNESFKFMKYVSDLLKKIDDIRTFDLKMKEHFDTSESEFLSSIESSYQSDNEMEEELKNKFRSCIQFSGNKSHLELVHNNIDFNKTSANGKLNTDKWLKKNGKAKELINVIIDFLGHKRSHEKPNLVEIISSELDVVLKEIVESIDKPIIEDKHIRNCIRVLDQKFFEPNKLIDQAKEMLNLPRVCTDILNFVYLRIKNKYIQLKNEQIQREKDEYRSFRENLEREARKDFDSKKNSKELGKNFCDKIIKKLFELISLRQNLKTDQSIPVICDFLRSPDDLIDLAFKESFESRDYENVYKYVTNITGYCNDVLLKYTDGSISSLLKNLIIEAETYVQEFIDAVIEITVHPELFSSCDDIYGFYEQLICQVENRTRFNSIQESICLKDCAYLTSNVNFSSCNENFNSNDNSTKHICHYQKSSANKRNDDLELFIKGFNNSLVNFKENNLKVRMSQLIAKLDSYLKIKREDYSRKLNGCNSECPCCKSKCNLDYGHEGNHRSKKHLIAGFSGIHEYETNIISNRFCWEKRFYLETRVVDKEGKPKADSLRQYVEKFYPEWLFDLDEKYAKYGKDPENTCSMEFKNCVIQGWMNVRKRLISKYELVDREDYPEDWLIFEQKNKML